MRKFIITLFVMSMGTGLQSQNWDIQTLHKINKLDGKFVRNFSKAASKTTPYIVAGVPLGMIVYAGFSKDKELLADALYIGSSVGEAVVLTYGMKHLIGRERPFERYSDKINAQNIPNSSSFPSSHTASAFSLAASLSIKYPKWYVIAPSTAWACSVGFARMNEGVHYPSDVIAGAIIGTGCAVVNVYVNRWLTGLLLPERQKPAAFHY